MTSDELRKVLEPTVERLGYELADLEDCEKVSHAVSALLDVEDPMAGEYNLEVSSPGLDRKLTKIEHFQRFEGETVKITMRFPIEGRRRFRGRLLSSDDKNIVVEVDGESHSLPLATLDTARLVPDAV